MKFINVRELKNNTSSILHYTENGEDVIVTSHGKPCAVIHHVTEETLEDYILANHPDFEQKWQRAYQEYQSGKTIKLDKLIEETEKEIGKI